MTKITSWNWSRIALLFFLIANVISPKQAFADIFDEFHEFMNRAIVKCDVQRVERLLQSPNIFPGQYDFAGEWKSYLFRALTAFPSAGNSLEACFRTVEILIAAGAPAYYRQPHTTGGYSLTGYSPMESMMTRESTRPYVVAVFDLVWNEEGVRDDFRGYRLPAGNWYFVVNIVGHCQKNDSITAQLIDKYVQYGSASMLNSHFRHENPKNGRSAIGDIKRFRAKCGLTYTALERHLGSF